MSKFCLGNKNNSSVITLKNMLLEHHLTERHFIIDGNDVYLDVSCTLLNCEKASASNPVAKFSALSYGGINIAVSHIKCIYNDSRYETILYQGYWSNLPQNLNNPIALKRREKKDALAQYQQMLSEKLNQHLEKFMTTHTELFEASRKVWCFGWFRRTKLPYNPTLKIVLEHAAKANNRSRRVCRSFGWLRPDGHLDNNAPQLIKSLNSPTIFNYDMLIKELSTALLQEGSQRCLFKEMHWLDNSIQLTEHVPQIIRNELVNSRSMPILPDGRMGIDLWVE
jgi:hypothetical protein